MSEIILPDSSPPRVTDKAADLIIDHIFTDGLPKVYDDALFFFRDRHPAFREFLLRFSFEQNGQTVENQFTPAAFRISAVITSFAYHESGFDVSIDDNAVALGEIGAEIEGVPDAFLARTVADPELQRLLSILPDTPLLQQDIANGGYEQILDIGAGATRFFMQQALAA